MIAHFQALALAKLIERENSVKRQSARYDCIEFKRSSDGTHKATVTDRKTFISLRYVPPASESEQAVQTLAEERFLIPNKDALLVYNAFTKTIDPSNDCCSCGTYFPIVQDDAGTLHEIEIANDIDSVKLTASVDGQCMLVLIDDLDQIGRVNDYEEFTSKVVKSAKPTDSIKNLDLISLGKMVEIMGEAMCWRGFMASRNRKMNLMFIPSNGTAVIEASQEIDGWKFFCQGVMASFLV